MKEVPDYKQEIARPDDEEDPSQLSHGEQRSYCGIETFVKGVHTLHGINRGSTMETLSVLHVESKSQKRTNGEGHTTLQVSETQ